MLSSCTNIDFDAQLVSITPRYQVPGMMVLVPGTSTAILDPRTVLGIFYITTVWLTNILATAYIALIS